MWHAHDGMGWWMVFGGVFWIIFLVTIVWLLVSLGSPRTRDDHGTRPITGDDAREIARQRYARGEINREEFQQILRDLDGSEPTASGSTGSG